MAKITGLGGVFYVVKDPEATRAWYRDVLGVDGKYGPLMRWSEDTGEAPYSMISHFSDETYIRPGTGQFMINLRVDDLEVFAAELRAKGAVVEGVVDEGYGKFAWLYDPDGIKIELWQQLREQPEG
jgi:catechol 2,3-dioxygenase-like lactoylglutathione lyase family enzyme